MIGNGCRKAHGNRNGKQRHAHAGFACRAKRDTNPCYPEELYAFENLKEMTGKTRCTGTAGKQITNENTEKVQPAKGPDDERRPSPSVAVVDQRRCAICGVCVDICAQHAISINENVIIDSYRCNGCGSCIEACPNEAISLTGI
jgi:ferredoxin